jgi:hypothetical protein
VEVAVQSEFVTPPPNINEVLRTIEREVMTVTNTQMVKLRVEQLRTLVGVLLQSAARRQQQQQQQQQQQEVSAMAPTHYIVFRKMESKSPTQHSSRETTKAKTKTYTSSKSATISTQPLMRGSESTLNIETLHNHSNTTLSQIDYIPLPPATEYIG